MLRLAEPAGPEPVESEASRRRGLMIIETAMELAGTGGGGRRDAMMQMDSGGGPFPNDGLHQLFRHYPRAGPALFSKRSYTTIRYAIAQIPVHIRTTSYCTSTVQAVSRKPVWWRGECGHVYQMAVRDRVRAKPGYCPYCSGRKSPERPIRLD